MNMTASHDELEHKQILKTGKEMMDNLEDTLRFFATCSNYTQYVKLPMKLKIIAHYVKSLHKPIYFKGSGSIDYDEYLILRKKTIQILKTYGRIKDIQGICSFPIII